MRPQNHDLHVGIAPEGEALRAGDRPQRSVPERSARVDRRTFLGWIAVAVGLVSGALGFKKAVEVPVVDTLSLDLIDEIIATATDLQPPSQPVKMADGTEYYVLFADEHALLEAGITQADLRSWGLEVDTFV